MSLFPLTCVDDFFNNPDEIREFALGLDYEITPGNYPGKRSVELSEKHPHYMDAFAKKIFSLFYDYDKTEIAWNITSQFQKIDPFSHNPKSLLNKGTIHRDGESGEKNSPFLVGVIYLTPDPYPESGTSFYEKEDHIKNYSDSSRSNFKFLDTKSHLYRNQYNNPRRYHRDFIQGIKENYKKYQKVVEIKNVYNRMVLYDGKFLHGQTNLYVGKNKTRLTQVFFIRRLDCENTPLTRCNNVIL